MNTRTMPNSLKSIYTSRELQGYSNLQTTPHGCLRMWFESGNHPTGNVLLLNPMVAGFLLSHLTLILQSDFLDRNDQVPGRFVLQRPPMQSKSIDNDFVMLSGDSQLITGNDFLAIEYMVGEELVNPRKIGAPFDEEADKEVRTREVLQLTISVCEGNEECTVVAHHQIQPHHHARLKLYEQYTDMISLAQRLYGKLN